MAERWIDVRAAICWMLKSWLTLPWALLGGMLAVPAGQFQLLDEQLWGRTGLLLHPCSRFLYSPFLSSPARPFVSGSWTSDTIPDGRLWLGI